MCPLPIKTKLFLFTQKIKIKSMTLWYGSVDRDISNFVVILFTSLCFHGFALCFWYTVFSPFICSYFYLGHLRFLGDHSYLKLKSKQSFCFDFSHLSVLMTIQKALCVCVLLYLFFSYTFNLPRITSLFTTSKSKVRLNWSYQGPRIKRNKKACSLSHVSGPRTAPPTFQAWLLAFYTWHNVRMELYLRNHLVHALPFADTWRKNLDQQIFQDY